MYDTVETPYRSDPRPSSTGGPGCSLCQPEKLSTASTLRIRADETPHSVPCAVPKDPLPALSVVVESALASGCSLMTAADIDRSLHGMRRRPGRLEDTGYASFLLRPLCCQHLSGPVNVPFGRSRSGDRVESDDPAPYRSVCCPVRDHRTPFSLLTSQLLVTYTNGVDITL